MKIALMWHDYYSGWGFTKIGWTIIISVAILLIIAICRFFSLRHRKAFEEKCMKIRRLGYKDLYDVQIFCLRIGADLDHFIYSKGLRKQYEIFSNGKTSQFIEKAESNKESEDAEDEGMATGLATGVIIGSCINSGQ